MIAQLGRAIFERALRVTIAIASVRTGELTININDNACFARAWARLIGGKNPRAGRGHDERLRLIKEAERDAQTLVLRGKQRALSIQGINENAANGSCG